MCNVLYHIVINPEALLVISLVNIQQSSSSVAQLANLQLQSCQSTGLPAAIVKFRAKLTNLKLQSSQITGLPSVIVKFQSQIKVT